EPEVADTVRTDLLVAVSHLTGQVPHELVDRDGSPWSRLVARVLHATRGETELAAAAPSSPDPDAANLDLPDTLDPDALDPDPLDPEVLDLAEATITLLAGGVPPVLPLPSDGDPVRGA